MKTKIELAEPFWWFWTVSLAFIMAAIAGWVPGYYAVIALSAIQVLVFLVRERSVVAFPTQIRVVYLLLALTGLWAAVRLPIYIVLLLGTLMVVLFGRCSISLLLQHMPWNRNRAARLV